MVKRVKSKKSSKGTEKSISDYKRLIEEIKTSDLSQAFENALPLRDKEIARDERAERLGGFVSSTRTPPPSPDKKYAAARAQASPRGVKSPVRKGSSRSNLSLVGKELPQLTDDDAAELSGKLLDSHEKIIRDVMKAYIKVKTNLIDENHRHERQMQVEHGRETERLHGTISSYRDRLTRCSTLLSQAGKMLDNYSLYASKQHHIQKYFWESKFSVRGCFLSWCEQIKWKRDKKSRKYRTKRHNELRLKKLIINRWRRNTTTALAIKKEQVFEAKLDRICAQIIEKYDGDIETIQGQLKEANLRTDLAQKQCVSMEEDMRRIFLKGVSAMNLEALSLFQDKTLAFTRADSCISNTDEAVRVASASEFETYMKESEKPRSSIPIPIPRST